MTDVIDTGRLGAYLDDETVFSSERAATIVYLVNSLIAEEWKAPVHPVPVKIELLALSVAARAWAFKPGRGPLESLTRSFDDSSRTERYAVPTGNGDGHEVFLTDAELALLHGVARRRVGSISLAVPRTWSWHD